MEGARRPWDNDIASGLDLPPSPSPRHQVLEITEEHHEIGDLLDRHATLEATNNDLRQQQKATADENEQTRAELQAYSKMKADEILNQNNQVRAGGKSGRGSGGDSPPRALGRMRPRSACAPETRAAHSL